MPRKLSPDKWLFGVTVALVLFGIVMVNSASVVLATRPVGVFSYFFLRQAAVALGSLALMWVIMRVDYQRYNNGWVVFSGLGLCAALLVAVLQQPGASSVRRWLQVGPLSFQPSELTKLFVVLFTAGFLARRGAGVNHLAGGLLPYLGVVGACAGLVAVEPDLGTAACILAVAMVLLFVAGVRWQYLAGTAAVALCGLLVLVLRNPYQLRRLLTFAAGGGADRAGAGYQIHQSLIAVGSGGVGGLGLGDGRQKLYFLPQPHSDFIFAVIGEELGLIGAALVALLFLLFFWRGVKAAVRAPDRFGYFLALGLTLMIVVQAFINISVALHLLPTKGIPLPFISMGGSSMLVSLVAAGVLLNVSQYAGGRAYVPAEEASPGLPGFPRPDMRRG